jgi:hypothetical protein
MLFPSATYIGIDPTAGRHPFAYAALDHDLRLLALGQGEMDEVLAFVGGQHHAYVAVCGPRRPSQGILDRPEIRQQLAVPPRPGRWAGYRLADYQMRMRNIVCPKIGVDESASPAWMRSSFILHQKLGVMGYRAYPSPDHALQCLEVYPHACFCALLGVAPFPKDTLEGRIQRQLCLHEQKVRLPDPMDIFEEITRHRLLQSILPLKELYTPAELDALAGAFTAWAAANHPERVTSLGHPDEGEIILPASELKNHY